MWHTTQANEKKRKRNQFCKFVNFLWLWVFAQGHLRSRYEIWMRKFVKWWLHDFWWIILLLWSVAALTLDYNSRVSSYLNTYVNGITLYCEAVLQQAFHMVRRAQLDLETPIYVHFLWAILTRKAHGINLVFGVRSGFVSRSVRTGLLVSVSCGYDLCQPG